MTLEEILRKIARDLGSNRLQNEEHTKLVAILPILRALGWDDTHPAEFVPEHPVGNGRVDYALFNPRNELPLVFIEAKRPGNAGEPGEDQLFAYAANQGVPFLILTDGDSWNFFISVWRRAGHRIENSVNYQSSAAMSEIRTTGARIDAVKQRRKSRTQKNHRLHTRWQQCNPETAHKLWLKFQKCFKIKIGVHRSFS